MVRVHTNHIALQERAGVRNGLGNIFASIPSLHSRAGPIEEAAAMSNTSAGWRRPLTPALTPGRGSQYAQQNCDENEGLAIRTFHQPTPWHQTPKAGTGQQPASRSGARQHAMLASSSAPGRLDSLRVIVIPAIGGDDGDCKANVVLGCHRGRQESVGGASGGKPRVSTGPEKAGIGLKPR